MSSPAKMVSWPVRTKLLSLLLILFLPATGIIIASGMERRALETTDARTSALLLVESLAAQQEQTVTGTKQMLSTLAQLPEVQKRDRDTCRALFRKLLDQYPMYSTITAVTPEGDVFASSNPADPSGVNISERKHIAEALETLDSSGGEYVVGMAGKVPSINYTYPVLSEDKNLIGFLTAGFTLVEYARFIEKANLPEGSRVVIADHKGVLLYHLPENEATALGEVVPDTFFKYTADQAKAGVYEATGAGGVYRICAFKQLRLREGLPPYLYMAVGIPKDVVLRRANKVMLRDLSLLGIVALTALALAWVFGDRSLKSIDRLVRASKHLAAGEIGTRTNIPHTSDELGRLAKAFDEMASQLDVRSIERDKSEEDLLEATQRLKLAVTSGKQGIWDWDIPSDTLTWNEQMFEFYGIRGSSFEGCSKAWESLLHPEDRLKVLEAVQAAIRGESKFDIEFRIIRPDGTVGVLKADADVIRDTNGSAIRMIGLSRDITEQKFAEESMRLLPSKLLCAQEEERKRICRELHDSIGAFLSAIHFKAESASGRIEGCTASPAILEELVSLTQQAMEEARRIMADLRPSLLDDLGVIPTISWFARQFQETYPSIHLEKKISLEEGDIPEPLKIVIFRAMQEAFNNIAKYSKADLVTLSLRRMDGALELSIADNGVGFELHQVSVRRSDNGGLGLTSMRERVELSGGTFTVESTLGEGTTVRATWPSA